MWAHGWAGAWFAMVAVLVAAAACGGREPRRVRLVTTTSVRDTGLLDVLLPEFTRETGLGVDVVAVGTGAAFRHGRDGNADLLLVHDAAGEDEFVASGHGAARRDLMWNSFEIAGPRDDPAHVRGAVTGADAFARIARSGASFGSRGDDSGTHRRERHLWVAAGVAPDRQACLETGQGMGATLIVADEKGAYVLTDSGTRLALRAKISLVPLCADAPDLRNEYALVLLSRDRHPAAAHGEAERLAEWLLTPATAGRIDAFRVGDEPLFHAARGGE